MTYSHLNPRLILRLLLVLTFDVAVFASKKLGGHILYMYNEVVCKNYQASALFVRQPKINTFIILILQLSVCLFVGDLRVEGH